MTVATFGAGAVIGAAAVGAALGAIGGVVMTASNDLINGEASSPSAYIKSAAQGAVIGAVCGAIFGPVAGISGGAVVPLTGGQTTVGLGSAMFMGGTSGYIDYSLRELWDGRTPDGGQALESFAVGAALGGAFSVGTSWLAKGAERVRGALKRGASSGVEATGNPVVKREFRTATQADKDLIDQLRIKYTAGKTRNVAAAKGKIGDDIINLESVSGKFTDKDYFNKGNFKPPQPDEYKHQGPISEFTNHTEQKIVGYLRTKYKDNPNIKGEIEIISERPYCDNCIDLVGSVPTRISKHYSDACGGITKRRKIE
ncbi:hypothetical protein [Brevibacillus gelatini]|uniref:hypothetical protein n=1 Tax=Brevibacillus gelatini TaxID=1655277 RepID=UPI0011CDAF75|nr:hypothetical protein [Brevibacillus gelatini]